MAFEKITENVENISLLADTPAMTSTELKAEFDKGNKTIKTKFNKLVDDLNNLGEINGTILFSNSDGTPGDITLNDNINNYSRVEIIYYVGYSDGNVYSATGKIPISSRIHLSSLFIGANSQLHSYCKRLNVSGTEVTVGSDRHYISTGGGTDGTYTYITKIVGYKN